MNRISIKSELLIAVLLFVAMIATRFHHFGSVLHLPDASWAIFFLGGFYLRKIGAMFVYIALAGLIDYFAITLMGTSSYCVTPAYAFLVPTYAALWFGGMWFAKSYQGNSYQTLFMLAGSVIVSTAVAFLISNASFYLLSEKFAELSVTEYIASVSQYFYSFLGTTAMYVAVAAVLHVAIKTLMASDSEHKESRQA